MLSVGVQFRFFSVCNVVFPSSSEAGGEVFDAAGRPLDFSRGRFLDLHAGIVATNSILKDKVLAAVRAALQAQQLSSKS